MKTLKKIVSSYFISKSHFEKDGTHKYLVFNPVYRYFKRISVVGCSNLIYFWTPKELSDENVTAPTTSDYIPNP